MEQMKEVMEKLYEMDEETFEAFCKSFPDEQVKIFAGMRFFHKLFNDPRFYNDVCKAVGEAVYDELRYAE